MKPYNPFEGRYTQPKRDIFDKMESHPVRTFLSFGLMAIFLNLLFWGIIIGGTLLGLNYFGVI